LNNSIAHQDYTLGGKVNVVEREDGFLTFVNSGSFIPQSIENVIESDSPETRYRNPFLTAAMVNLNMIDTIGSGIKKMFVIQKNKFFPLPDYDFTDNKVKVKITGKVVDVNYSSKLAEIKDLSLQEIILLDKVAKQKRLTKEEAKVLKSKKYIEGRSPNFHISSKVANVTGERAKYIQQRGIDDEYCMKMILDYLQKFDEGVKSDFEKLLLDKLPDVLDIQQKKNKIKNILQRLKNEGLIIPFGKSWRMSKK
jgi:ATP-dependent DNA helicase RecG